MGALLWRAVVEVVMVAETATVRAATAGSQQQRGAVVAAAAELVTIAEAATGR
jgi:hypothetical protein